MRLFRFAPARKLLLAAAVLLLAAASTPSRAQDDDPPAQAGRLSFVSGAVSFQQLGADDWVQAAPNYPLGPGDRIFTDSDGRAEIQIGRTYLRIGPNSDLTFVNYTPRGLSFGLASGSVHLRAHSLWPGQTLHINTPNGTATLPQPGELRVDVLNDQEAALFTSFNGAVLLAGAGGYEQYLDSGQAVELVGTNPVFPQWFAPAELDDLDRWSQQRDRQMMHIASYQYVSPEMPGVEDLDANGIWLPGTEYGAIWFPNNVPAGWAPYHYGHWVNHAPWGWVWVEEESWGYAPFHYGRWVNFGGRWGWVPGPPAAHPVWSPALVAFGGGVRVGGVGVSVWFPLGPGEAYRPWYHCSPHYVDQVNITNIQESRRVHVQTTYVNVVNVTNVTYVNRTIGVSAMSHDDFAAGRPAAKASVHVDVNVINKVTVIERPEPQPVAHVVIGKPPARPVPVAAAHPVLINESGKLTSAKPGAVAVEPPVKPAPQIKPLPGRTVVAPPPAAKPAPGAAQPAKPLPAPAAQPAKPAPAPAAQPAKPTPGVQPAKPVPGAQPVKPTPAPAPAAQPTKPAPAAQPAKPTPPPQPAKPAPAPAAQPVKPAPAAQPVKPAPAPTAQPAKP
ncbi:MAG: DUF6600 domain-containing protein, partial [Terracidiphilus sp.]